MKNFLFAALTFVIATNANKLELSAQEAVIPENCQLYQYEDYGVEDLFRTHCTGKPYTKGTPPVKHWCKVITHPLKKFMCVP